MFTICFQFKPVWTTRLPTLYASIVTKKGSHFRRFFSQEIRRLETTGNLDLLRKRYSGSQACKPPALKEKPLGYGKLSFLFVMLIFGCIMSILVVFFEYKTQTKKNEQEIKNEDKEMSLIEEKMGKYLEGLSNRKTETILGRLNPKHPKKDKEKVLIAKRSMTKSHQCISQYCK